MAHDVDFFVIGGGSGGVRAARWAAQRGAKVAIAEERYWGGTCVNVGCIPKKLFAYAAHYAHDFADARGYGWGATTPAFDWPTLRNNKDREITRLNGIYERLLVQAGVAIHRGRAVLNDADTVTINGQRITAKYLLIATGGWPVKPDIPGAEHAITSNEAFHLETLPKRVAIVGGGYIAVEFASILNGLGVETTLLYRGATLLKEFDHDLGTHLAQEMSKKGVNVRLNTNVTAIEKRGSALYATLTDGVVAETDCIMFATGRAPLTRGFGVEAIGVQLAANGAIHVDDNFRTNVANVYAVGDCIDRIHLTPVALAEGMVVAEALFDKGQRTMSYDAIPTAVFSDPNIATVGLSEQHARSRGHEVTIYRSTFTALKHTMTGNGERCLLKLVVDKQTDRVLGLHMVGADAGEIVQGFAVAVKMGATKRDFDATIGIHPTMAEEFVTMRAAVG